MPNPGTRPWILQIPLPLPLVILLGDLSLPASNQAFVPNPHTANIRSKKMEAGSAEARTRGNHPLPIFFPHTTLSYNYNCLC
jgi:hypothetical protein